MRFILPGLLLLLSHFVSGQRITGTVYTDTGDLLPFASVMIKGTSIGTSANNKGNFTLSVKNGTYQVICQHIGYKTIEKTIVVNGDTEATFILPSQKLILDEVVVKSGGEDPAYAIIREAIKKRSYYNEQVKGFSTEMYSKDIMRLRKLPKQIFGKKIKDEDATEMGLDSSRKGIIYLSETMSTVHVAQPDKFKMEVHSSRVSGSESFGFTFPVFISLYKSNVMLFAERLNPRGFISPIADGAISFYKFRFLGSFWENDRMVNSIQVIPRRLYEPLFSGTINITDGDWRIHSFDLLVTKSSQLELLDTLRVRQLHIPVGNDVWKVKDQLLYFNFKALGIDAIGNFLTVFSDYRIDPVFEKKFFDRVIMKYDSTATKHTPQYWDSVRPVPLEDAEQMDYKVKDSIYHQRKDSMLSQRYIDSVNKARAGIKPLGFLWGGVSKTRISKKHVFTWKANALLPTLEYNPAEGAVSTLKLNFTWRRKNNSFQIDPHFRYGFYNGHFNPSVRLRFEGSAKHNSKFKLDLSGGKRVTQFNKESNLKPLINSISTLLYGNNYMKTYENYFGEINYNRRFDNGIRFILGVLYENRLPLNNSTNFTLSKKDSVNITPNYPYELISEQFKQHQALALSFSISVQPGQRYIQFPYFRLPVGSSYPTFTLDYSKGIHAVFGSDVDFDKWRLTAAGSRNFKLAGNLNYKIGGGGFFNDKSVPVQDYQHFNGNKFRIAASEYVNSFQLAPFYANSTTASLYSFGHLEHHFNGLLTNKIPLFRKLNWTLVGGGNAFYVNNRNNYVEIFGGIENIFKIFRVDFVAAYQNGKQGLTGVRVGAGGALGGNIKQGQEENTISISF